MSAKALYNTFMSLIVLSTTCSNCVLQVLGKQLSFLYVGFDPSRDISFPWMLWRLFLCILSHCCPQPDIEHLAKKRKRMPFSMVNTYLMQLKDIYFREDEFMLMILKNDRPTMLFTVFYWFNGICYPWPILLFR